MRVTKHSLVDRYYKALIDRDSSFVGIFFVGVKTTSIFCLATCRARKPKRENVEFFTEFKDALDYGYRPCKICRPTENAHEAPEFISRLIEQVRNNPKEKLSDQSLREQQINPEQVRRWFKKNYGMTFQAFQRMYRVNCAFQELKGGSNATVAAMDSGYESLSGFGYTYKKVLGKSPNNSMDQYVVLISRLTTPLGPMFVCATDQGVCLLEFVDRRMLETEFEQLQKRLNAKIIAGENHHIRQLKNELAEYFEGTRTTFDISLHTPGTGFQNEVWSALLSIPYGKTRSYSQQAEYIGKPGAFRAVASANGMNRISIVVPCHRVIGSDGHLTGYGGGLERKRWLIEHEVKHARQFSEAKHV